MQEPKSDEEEYQPYQMAEDKAKAKAKAKDEDKDEDDRQSSTAVKVELAEGPSLALLSTVSYPSFQGSKLDLEAPFSGASVDVSH